MKIQSLEELGRIVRFHRKKCLISQIELAKLAGVGKTAIFDLEKGKKSTRFSTLINILHVLNISIKISSPLLKNKNILEEFNGSK